MAKPNQYVNNYLAELREKETTMSGRSGDLQKNIDAHNSELAEVKAAIKVLEAGEVAPTGTDTAPAFKAPK